MRTARSFLIVIAITAISLLVLTERRASANVYVGTNTGPIPDGLTGTPPQFGPPRVVDFVVSGQSAPIGSISVDLTMDHTWMGDVDVVLSSPGGVASHILVSRVGVTAVGDFGDSSNYLGLYQFWDGSSLNIWTVASTACGDTCDVAPNSYRTTAPGVPGQSNPAPVTTMLTPFVGLSTAQINGTWTLSIRDAAEVDTGNVTAASLNLITPSAAAAAVSGKVVTADGRGISRARVTVTNLATGVSTAALTGSFGYFLFEGLETGNQYMLTVEHGKHQFAGNQHVFTLQEDAHGFEFVALEP